MDLRAFPANVFNSGSDLLVIKTKQLNERAEKLEAAAKPAHQDRSAGDIKLVNSGTHAKALVTDSVPVLTLDILTCTKDDLAFIDDQNIRDYVDMF